MKNFKVIAEGCCNHQGSFEMAIEMVNTAKLCGADFIKWQKRNPIECVPSSIANLPHPHEYNSFGKTYIKHREHLEFTIDQHMELKKYSEQIGIGYACSVWDITSAEQIISLNPQYIKIPSACNNDLSLISKVFSTYDGEVHISLGMLNNEDKYNLFSYLKKYKDRSVLYHTTTEYPCPFEHIFLNELSNIPFEHIGFSGHHRGIAIDVAAYVYGARWFERHFTLDRTLKGSDHSASLEPDGLKKLIRDLNATQAAMQYKNAPTKEEMFQAAKLRPISSMLIPPPQESL